MIGFRGEKLRLSISQAVADGHAVRRAREQARHAAEQAAARALSEQREARVREVLSALPQSITQTVARATALPAQCIVMFVRPSEYEGVIHHDFYTQTPKPPVYPDRLRCAAAWVFEELQVAGCAPTLQYEYQFGADLTDSQPSTLDQLCICISVQ